MNDKKNLTKVALAALLLASTLPVDGQAEVQGTKETLLAAAGCASCKAAARKFEIADNAMDGTSHSPSSSQSSSYGSTGSTYTGTSSGMGTRGTGNNGSAGSNGSAGYGSYGSTGGDYNTMDSSRMNSDLNSSRNANSSYNTAGTYNDSYSNEPSNYSNGSSRNYNNGGSYSGSYNRNNMGYRNGSYGAESYNRSSYDVNAYPNYRESRVNVNTYPQYREDRVNINTYPDYRERRVDINAYPDREYNVSRDYDYNRATVTTTTAYGTLTEEQLLSILNPQGRAIYMSLDAEGKGLALQLASQDSYPDKNIAVREAQRKINERRGLISR